MYCCQWWRIVNTLQQNPITKISKIIRPISSVLPPSRMITTLPKRTGCCGGEIFEFLQKGGEIAEGYINLKLGKKLEFTDRNMQTCLTCEFQTWLTTREYISWLLANKVKVLVNFRDLTVLPPLPKKEKIEYGQHLYCMLCKCYLEAKTRSKSKCPKGKYRFRRPFKT